MEKLRTRLTPLHHFGPGINQSTMSDSTSNPLTQLSKHLKEYLREQRLKEILKYLKEANSKHDQVLEKLQDLKHRFDTIIGERRDQSQPMIPNSCDKSTHVGEEKCILGTSQPSEFEVQDVDFPFEPLISYKVDHLSNPPSNQEIDDLQVDIIKDKELEGSKEIDPKVSFDLSCSINTNNEDPLAVKSEFMMEKFDDSKYDLVALNDRKKKKKIKQVIQCHHRFKPIKLGGLHNQIPLIVKCNSLQF